MLGEERQPLHKLWIGAKRVMGIIAETVFNRPGADQQAIEAMLVT